MKIKLCILLAALIFIFSSNIYAGGGPSPTCSPTFNSSCLTAAPIVSGSACLNASTASGGPASGSSACIGAGYECSWYSFVATATSMYVNIGNTVVSGCYTRSEVFSAGGGGGNCGALASISCQSGAPLDDLHALSGLTIGNTYFVSVCYSPGGPCGNAGCADFCIEVGEPDPPCNTCAGPCGTAAGYPTAPAVQQVVDDCTTSPFIPELQAGSTNTFCYDFQATATSVDFNVIITSNCGAGNVTNFTWELFDITCGAAIQTGTLASLTFSPVVIGNQYVFCYTFDVPAGCTHSQHCPFFVGATPILLPINLSSFTATASKKIVLLDWKIVNQGTDYDFFIVERSNDAITFETIAVIKANQTSTDYSTQDTNPLPKTSYYRLKMKDINGNDFISDIVAISREEIEYQDKLYIHKVYPQPSGQHLNIDFEPGNSEQVAIKLMNSLGQIVYQKQHAVNASEYNKLTIDLGSLGTGIYTLIVIDEKSKVSRLERVIIQ